MSSGQQGLDDLRRTLDEAALEDVAALVAEARLEARSKVRAMLAEALAERMLELAERELKRPPDASSTASAAATPPADAVQPAWSDEDLSDAPATDRSADAGLACYVYGVVEADAELEPTLGLDDLHQVFLVRADGIAAVTSLVSMEEFGEDTLRGHLEDLEWLEHHARRHEQILDRVRERASLVPMRLCTIYRDETSLRAILDREHDFLADALERLRGRVEWGLKVYGAADAGEEPPPGAASEDQGGAGASYLKDRRRLHLRHERTAALTGELCERAHADIATVAVEAKRNRVQPRELTDRVEPMVFNAAYLIDEDESDRFMTVVDEARDELARQGLDAELSGPWPPYNFVNDPAAVGP